mgnify:CR=1 FL=1
MHFNNILDDFDFEGNELPLWAEEGEVVAKFFSPLEAELAAAWRQAQPAIEQMIAGYHSQVLQAVFDANAYLRNPTSGSRGRRFQIFLDVLAAPNQVHTRSFGDDYFVVERLGLFGRLSRELYAISSVFSIQELVERTS